MQGLPYGFQAKALPVALRESGVPLGSIGLLSALSAPWMLKPLWAPLVDSVYNAKFGRRKSWIVPLQAAMALVCLALAQVDRQQHVGLVLAGVFALNLGAATQDIAVDGLAVDLLDASDLGSGNAAQVAGFKIGMLFGGGVLLWLSDLVGWGGLFYGMATVIAAVAAVMYVFPEAPPAPAAPQPALSMPGASSSAAAPAPPSPAPPATGAITRWLGDVYGSLVQAPELRWALLLIMTYKTGESIIDVMFKPFLLDSGWSGANVGWYSGVYGMGFSLLGSVMGGWAIDHMTLAQVMLYTFLLRPWPLMAKAALAAAGVPPSPTELFAVIATESFFGGALTTAMFAFMMSLVDTRYGATQFTTLSALELIGRSAGSFPSGFLAERHGYLTAFVIGTALSWLVVLLVPLVHNAHPHLHKRPTTGAKATSAAAPAPPERPKGQ